MAGFAISELVLAEDIKEGLPVHGVGDEPVHVVMSMSCLLLIVVVVICL